MIPAEDHFEIPYKIVIQFGRPIGELRVTAILLACERKRPKPQGAVGIVHCVVDVAPGVLREQIDAALQQVGIATNLQVDGLNQGLNPRKSRSLEARLGSLKAIADLDSRDWEKTDSAANRLVVVVIRVAVEIQCTRSASVESIQDRTVGNIKGVIHAGRGSETLRAPGRRRIYLAECHGR